MNAFAHQSVRGWPSADAAPATASPKSAEPQMLADDDGHASSMHGYRREVPKNWYTLLAYPLLSLFRDPESANQLSKFALNALPWLFQDTDPDDEVLRIDVFGRTFSNPIGMAAGWDKDADKFAGLFGVGFGFVEVGTVTPLPQGGNPRRRVFRLPKDSAIINRMGFPSEGLPYVLDKLKQTPRRGILGINVGANKDTQDRVADYVTCASALAKYADYLVCNVSSPNTPGLRTLQTLEHLSDLVRRVQDGLDESRPPLLVKIAPDASEAELDDIVKVCRNLGVSGLIVGNTTTRRPAALRSACRQETGGLSGSPLTVQSTHVLKAVASRCDGQLPLIGCGGVFSGDDAYEKIKSGASLIQLYTALIYGGPQLVKTIKKRLAIRLKADGYKSVSDAVGADIRR